jgi:hypothetical protein
MISESLVSEVKRLVAEGRLSQRKIARLTGVSRGTVGAIAAGRRCDHPRPPSPDDEIDEPPGPPERCPGCGAIVYPPCRLCRLRSLLAAGRIPRRPERPLGPLGLELHDEHRKRYEQVRARCRRHGELRANGQSTFSAVE